MIVSEEFLKSLEALEENWDSYGAQPPTQQALDILRHLHVTPTNEGGLQFEWHTKDYTLELVINPNGRFESLFTNEEAY